MAGWREGEREGNGDGKSGENRKRHRDKGNRKKDTVRQKEKQRQRGGGEAGGDEDTKNPRSQMAWALDGHVRVWLSSEPPGGRGQQVSSRQGCGVGAQQPPPSSHCVYPRSRSPCSATVRCVLRPACGSLTSRPQACPPVPSPQGQHSPCASRCSVPVLHTTEVARCLGPSTYGATWPSEAAAVVARRSCPAVPPRPHPATLICPSLSALCVPTAHGVAALLRGPRAAES